MTTNNSATVRRIFEGMSSGDEAVLNATIEKCYTPDVAHHGMGEEFSGRDGVKEMARSYLTAFPDITVTIEAQVESGDTVVTRIVATGTNSGEFDGKPPTGKGMRMTAISMARFVDGKVAEEWEEGDMLGMMTQIGHLPA